MVLPFPNATRCPLTSITSKYGQRNGNHWICRGSKYTVPTPLRRCRLHILKDAMHPPQCYCSPHPNTRARFLDVWVTACLKALIEIPKFPLHHLTEGEFVVRSRGDGPQTIGRPFSRTHMGHFLGILVVEGIFKIGIQVVRSILHSRQPSQA